MEQLNQPIDIAGFTAEELRLLVEHPMVLEIAADINDVKAVEAQAMCDGDCPPVGESWNEKRAAQLRKARNTIIAEDPDLWGTLLDGQVADFMDGYGASEDIRAIKAALLEAGLKPDTANRVMWLIVGKEWRCNWVSADNPPAIQDGHSVSRSVIVVTVNGRVGDGFYLNCDNEKGWIAVDKPVLWTEIPSASMRPEQVMPPMTDAALRYAMGAIVQGSQNTAQNMRVLWRLMAEYHNKTGRYRDPPVMVNAIDGVPDCPRCRNDITKCDNWDAEGCARRWGK